MNVLPRAQEERFLDGAEGRFKMLETIVLILVGLAALVFIIGRWR